MKAGDTFRGSFFGFAGTFLFKKWRKIRMTKDLILDSQSNAALTSIMKITGKNEATCILLALVFFAEALIYATAFQNTKGNQKPDKTADNLVGSMKPAENKKRKAALKWPTK